MSRAKMPTRFSPDPGFHGEKLLGREACCRYRFGVSVSFTILGSGSAGNCAYLETRHTRLLLDAGFSGRQIRARLESIGRKVEDLDGILVTHEHSDHITGIKGLSRSLEIPIYCNRLTAEAIQAGCTRPLPFRRFATGDAFSLGDVQVETFSVPHDAYDPVNFLIRTESGNVCILTDLGHATQPAIRKAREAHVLLLESNYDVGLLQADTKRPWSIKQRILSRHGHLSNEAAAKGLKDMMHGGLRQLYLGHLSRDCNTPEHARNETRKTLIELGVPHLPLEVASQDQPMPTFHLGDSSERVISSETLRSEDLESPPR